MGHEDAALSAGESAPATSGAAAHTVDDAAVVIAETDVGNEDAAPAAGE